MVNISGEPFCRPSFGPIDIFFLLFIKNSYKTSTKEKNPMFSNMFFYFSLLKIIEQP